MYVTNYLWPNKKGEVFTWMFYNTLCSKCVIPCCDVTCQYLIYTVCVFGGEMTTYT